LNLTSTRAAQADLQSIGAWIARDNPVRARSFVAELVNVCQLIAEVPLGYPVVSGGRYPVRRKNHERYRIFFRALPHEVRVIAVTHAARNTRPV
jgi:plasmid stabilization system protein ParE